ncbi:hypothetical protein F5146DRAFT_483388 [Armillaria mellea]|nr:hypothetical protein F5146DRAFT_483388 [Armillaria mellea]
MQGWTSKCWQEPSRPGSYQSLALDTESYTHCILRAHLSPVYDKRSISRPFLPPIHCAYSPRASHTTRFNDGRSLCLLDSCTWTKNPSSLLQRSHRQHCVTLEYLRMLLHDLKTSLRYVTLKAISRCRSGSFCVPALGSSAISVFSMYITASQPVFRISIGLTFTP